MNVYKYYNAHPRGLTTDDCVKRAISVTTGMAYRDVQRELNRYKKVTGAKRFNSNENPHRYVECVLKADKIVLPQRLTAAQFCRKYPSGRYILDMEGHWSSCVDGVIYDTWDPSDQYVNFAYEIVPVTQTRTIRYGCTAEPASSTQTRIRIYDGNGAFVERTIPSELTDGYIRCLEDLHYIHINL